mgnify:CR=1 FL=1
MASFISFAATAASWKLSGTGDSAKKRSSALEAPVKVFSRLLVPRSFHRWATAVAGSSAASFPLAAFTNLLGVTHRSLVDRPRIVAEVIG